MAEEQIVAPATQIETGEDLIAALRGLLAQRPSEKMWGAILELFRAANPNVPIAPVDCSGAVDAAAADTDAADADAALMLGLGYAEEHLASWPAALRLISVDDLLLPHGVLGRSLWIYGDDDGALQAPHAQPTLAQLERLNLYYIDLEDSMSALLAAIPTPIHLRALRLLGCSIDADDLQVLLALSLVQDLEELQLASCGIGGQELEMLLASDSLRSLQTLSLANNYLVAKDIRNIASTPWVVRLGSLDLSFNMVGDEAIRALRASPHLTGLKQLTLAHELLLEPGSHTLSPKGLLGLIYPSSLRSLEELHLTFVENEEEDALSPEAVRQGLSPHWLHQFTSALPVGPYVGFKSIEIVGMPLSLSVLKAMLDSPKMAGVKLLNLSGAKIGNDGLAAMAACEALSQLEELHLDECEIGDSGLLSLVLSPHLHNLRRLSLRDNLISAGKGPMANEAVVALARSPHFAMLEELCLIDNPLQEEGLGALAAITSSSEASIFPKLWKVFVGGESLWKRHEAMLSPPPAHIEIVPTWHGSPPSRPPGVARDTLVQT